MQQTGGVLADNEIRWLEALDLGLQSGQPMGRSQMGRADEAPRPQRGPGGRPGSSPGGMGRRRRGP